jgi:integrase
MASLIQRGKVYYIVFSQRVGEKLYQKRFSLGTTDYKEAKNLKYDFEKQYELGRIDPFNGWTPKQERETARKRDLSKKLTTLKQLSNKFVSERSQANEVSKNNYRTHLNMLMKQVGETLPVKLVSEKDVRSICFQPRLKTATQASYLKHFKVFFRWLKENEFVDSDVTSNIKPPKISDKISERTITESELEKIFSAYRKDILEKKKKRSITTEAQSRVWFRPVAMIAFYAGLRRKEIVNLQWTHINFDEGIITVTESKSGKERTVPIRKKLYKVLKAWHKKGGYPLEGLVFPSKKAYTENVKMSKRNVTRVFKYYAKKAKLSDSINFHGLRHSCGTELMRLGFDINEVAKILGHSSLEMTRIYEHLTSKDLTDKMLNIEGELSEHEKEKKELRDKIKKLEKENTELRESKSS